ncbi:hypothetical protein BMS3Abin03_01588 [bacterium BMS3Abin03]|nr:hypothetical protein BMS3Abin03_01588 [bacterium BMS3Abin03]
MKNLLFFLLLLLAAFAGCNKEDNIVTPAAKTLEIVPLKVGNVWSYQTTTYDTSGNIISTSVDSFSIVSDTIINGRKTFILSTGVLRWNNESGYWVSTNTDSLLLYKYPANVGDQYSSDLKVISIDSMIVIPRGTFRCYGYSGSVAIDYVSPGVGLTKEEWYKNKFNGVKYLYQKQELLDYQLK